MMSNTKILHTLKVAASALVLCALAACSTVDRGRAPALQANAEWTVLPFANHTETPMAGNRAESVAEALLHARGVGKVKRYTSTAQQEALFDAGDTKRQEQALAWAREQGVRYALAGGGIAPDQARQGVRSQRGMKRGVVAAHRQLAPVAAHTDKDLATEGKAPLTALTGIGIQSGLHHVQRTQAAAQILGAANAPARARQDTAFRAQGATRTGGHRLGGHVHHAVQRELGCGGRSG